MEYGLNATPRKRRNQSDGRDRSGERTPAKRVPIVSLRLVRDGSVLYANRTIACANDAYELMRLFLERADREKVVVISVSSKNTPVNVCVSSVGSLDAAIVSPRETFKTAVVSNAAAVLVGHVHPSGDPEPSPEDIQITKRLADAGRVLGIELLDHLVIGEGRYVSLLARGYVK